MRARWLLPVLLILSAASSGHTVAPRTQDEPSAATRIVASALGPSPLEENLRRLTDEIGGRMSGTPAMRKAVVWGIEAFRKAGVDEVHAESFTMPVGWREGETRLTVLRPAQFSLQAVSLGWSPPAEVEAPVVLVGTGTESEFVQLKGHLRGALLLVESDLLEGWAGLFGEYLRSPSIIGQAVQAGAAGILWTSTREHRLLYRHQNSFLGETDRLPQALVAREDAQRLARLLRAGHPVWARLSMPNVVRGPVEEQNVVAEIRGREKPEEVVILGAHLDSWELGTGALDNGVNCALVVDVARTLAESGLRPRRTVRFILFSGEEQGLLGSLAYIKTHKQELDNNVAAVIYDMGDGRVTGYSLQGRKDIGPAVREVLQPVESWGANELTTDAFMGTDNFDFLLEGIPTLVANQEPADYIENYHAASDTFDKVDIRDVKLHTAYAAVTLWGIAERPERLGPRQSRTEVEKLILETALDQAMKLFGLWPQWQQGTRGRQP